MRNKTKLHHSSNTIKSLSQELSGFNVRNEALLMPFVLNKDVINFDQVFYIICWIKCYSK